jgi:hypothetical protein
VDVALLLEDITNARQRVGSGSLDLAEPEGLKRPRGADA